MRVLGRAIKTPRAGNAHRWPIILRSNTMKFYVASGIKNKESVKEVFERLKESGHEVTVDWTLTDDIPEDSRDNSKEYIRSIAKRDYEGIRECDVFVLMSDPPEGRSMYVEIGLALALRDTIGKPMVFVVGPLSNKSVFYYHPLVRRVESWDDVIQESQEFNTIELPSKSHEGRLEEFKALRAEMLEIIKERVWGQATYAALSAGMLALMGDSGKVPALIFTMVLALPFLFHTMQREHARIRMGNYIRIVLEPKIPGMYWEEYLGLWRGRFGRKEGKGWLNVYDRLKHIFSFAGLYLLISGFCWFYLFIETNEQGARILASLILCIVLSGYIKFVRLYSRGQKEYEELQRLGPKA